MKTLFIVLFFTTIAFAKLPSAENYLGSYELLQQTLFQIDATIYGGRVLDTIALQLSNKSPIGDVSGLLRDMMADLRNQQQKSDTAWATKDKQCKETLGKLEGRIKKATGEIEDSSTALVSLGEAKFNLEQDINDGKAGLEYLDESEEQARSQRATEKEAYFKRQEKTNSVLDALRVIIPKVKAITPHTASDVFMELAKLGTTNPIASLVQLSSALNPEALAKCTTLLVKLESDFEIFLEEDTENEVEAQVSFDAFIIATNALRKSTTKKLAKDESDLFSIVEPTITQQEKRLESNEQELDTAGEAKGLATEQCNLAEESYTTDKASRASELEVLDTVANIIATRLQGLNEFIETR